MELLIGLVVLVVVGLMAMGAAGILGFGIFAHGEKQRAKAQASASQTLNRCFSGQLTVSYNSSPVTSLRKPVVVEGALRRGYTLVHEDGGTLLFQLQGAAPAAGRAASSEARGAGGWRRKSGYSTSSDMSTK